MAPEERRAQMEIDLGEELANDPALIDYTGSQPDGYASTREILNRLGSPRMIVNTEPAPQVPKPATMDELIAIVPASERARLRMETVEKIVKDVDAFLTTNRHE